MTDDEAVAMLRSVADHDKVDVLVPKGDMVVCTPAELARAMRAYGKACADAERERVMADLRQALQDDSNTTAIRKGE